MERLTKRDTDGQAMMDCQKCKADWTGKHGKPMDSCTALYCRNRLKDRIAAYEDSGWAPEEVLPKDKAEEITLKLMRLADLESLCSFNRLRELAEADKDGRVVVLPCKVGDTVYFALLGNIIEKQVFSIVAFSNSTRIYCGGTSEYFRPEDIGKTFFLTREEAEKALEAARHE